MTMSPSRSRSLSPSRSRSLLVSAVMTACALVAAGCATTIVTATTTSTTPPTTTVPSGDMTALMNNIVAAAGRMGARIAEGDNDAARTELEAARRNWEALEPLIVESGIDAVESVEGIIGLMTTSIDRRRPADADKAYLFGLMILESFSERQG